MIFTGLCSTEEALPVAVPPQFLLLANQPLIKAFDKITHQLPLAQGSADGSITVMSLPGSTITHDDDNHFQL